jgi:hypothetical protein
MWEENTKQVQVVYFGYDPSEKLETKRVKQETLAKYGGACQ